MGTPKHLFLVWDDAKIATLTELWTGNKHSADQIGQKLGCSRSAVIGKAHRLGLAKRGEKAGRSTGYYKPKSQAMPKAPGIKFGARKKLKPVRAWDCDATDGPYVPPAEEIVIPVGERKQLIDLDARDCRWPIGDPQHADFHFCGRVQYPGLVYCEHHARIAYKLPPVVSQGLTGRPFVFAGHPGSSVPRPPAEPPRIAQDGRDGVQGYPESREPQTPASDALKAKDEVA